MSKLKRPLRLWHGLLAIVAAQVGKHYYGFKQRNTPGGDSQTRLRLRCPRGTKVIAGGGGGFSTEPNEQNVNFTGPFDSGDRGRKPEDGWWMFVNNDNAEGGEGMEVSAICVERR